MISKYRLPFYDSSFGQLVTAPVTGIIMCDLIKNVLVLSYLCLFVIQYCNLFSDLEDPALYRDLSKPVGALNEERLLKLLVSIHT